MRKKSLRFIMLLILIGVSFPINVKADDSDCSWYEEYGEHDWSYSSYDAEDLDSNYHGYLEQCEECGLTRYEKEKHDWYDEETFKKCDSNYHYRLYECLECDRKQYFKKKHKFKYSKLIQWATPKYDGIFQYKCSDCGYICKKKVKWSYSKVNQYVDGYASYDVGSRNNVYCNSKYVTVKTYSYDTGYVIKLKVGKKTYTKKMNGKTNKYKFKIKKASYGSKIDIGIYYKGKRVGKDESNAYNKVLYAKNMKIGMTKKQLKCTYRFLNHWGNPSSTAASTGGWSYWYYNDGSYIIFRYGKVKGWYDVN